LIPLSHKQQLIAAKFYMKIIILPIQNNVNFDSVLFLAIKCEYHC